MTRAFVDLVDRHQVAGWAPDDSQPDAPLRLLILDNDVLVARVLANRHRADLEAAGIGGAEANPVSERCARHRPAARSRS